MSSSDHAFRNWTTPRSRSIRGDQESQPEISRKPVIKRVGTGRRARVTVETGGESGRYQQQQELQETFRRERSRTRFELDRQSRKSAPSTRYTKSRRNSSPVVISYSPVRRQSRVSSGPGSVGGIDDEPISSQDSDDEDNNNFEFVLPKEVKRVKIAEHVQIINPDPDTDKQDVPKPLPSELPPQTAKQKFNGPMTELSILQSQWVGSTMDRGDLGGELSTAISSSEQNEKQPSSLLKWYHLERFMMNFEEFTAASLSVLQMSERELRDVARLLRDVQKKFEKQRHHGRDMDPDCVSDIFFSDSHNRSRQTASVMFMSFPYFSLDPYSSAPIKALAPGSPLHPLRPLLQAHFYATTRERELAQVISSMGSHETNCLHLSQIWCLIVNGSTMVTCSRRAFDDLCGDVIKKTPAVPSEYDALIKVSLSSDRSWSIPITTRTSWPEFVSLFGDKAAKMALLGSSIIFDYDDRMIDGKSWPDIAEQATRTPVELRIRDASFVFGDDYVETSSITEPEQYDEMGFTPRKSQSTEQASDTVDSEEEEQLPPALTKRPTLPLEPPDTLQMFKHSGGTFTMRRLADSLHNVLNSNSRGEEKSAYRKCTSSKIAEINEWLSKNREQSSEDLTKEAVLLRRYKRRVASIARHLFNIFWPSSFEHPMTDKYWGALDQIISRENEFFHKGHDDFKTDFAEAATIYRVLYDEVFPVASSLSREFLNYEHDLKPLPEGFSKAWLHLTTALVLAAETTLSKKVLFGSSPINKHLHAIVDELDSGKTEVISRLRTAELEDLEICSESSLLALIMNHVARDMMRGRPDVTTTYNDYLATLEFNITQNPVPRSHQQTLRYFLQEVEAIMKTLESQLSVVDVFQQGLEQQSTDGSPLLFDALGESRQTVVIEDCKAWICGRIDKFKSLEQRALELGEWHRNQMDTNKDRQENAIMIFTIVTIIFLPLSFVSSVFGMNTSDIRNMPYTQWTYWAAGLPLTFVIIIGALWLAGELEGLGKWISRITSRSKKGARYDKFKESAQEAAGRSRWRRRSRSGDSEDLEQLVTKPKRRSTYPHKEQ